MYALVIGNMVFPFIISILNWIAIRRELYYVQEINKTFLRVGISATCMGVLAYFTYTLLHTITRSNMLSVVIAIVAAIFVYATSLILFRAVEEDELYELPKGRFLVKFAKKFGLL